MNQKKISILITLSIIYIFLKFIPYGNTLLYPVNLIVTFLHEFWHGFFAVVTGWTFHSLQVNSDGSGLATTSGGLRPLVILWGYIGSAIFGNLLLYFAIKSDKIAERIMYGLWGFMIFSSVYFFAGIVSSLIIASIGWVMIYIAKKFDYDSIILSFLGLASIFHIILDFRVWPSSDLAHFSEIFIFIPQTVWMYIWLIIVIWITGLNIKYIFKK